MGAYWWGIGGVLVGYRNGIGNAAPCPSPSPHTTEILCANTVFLFRKAAGQKTFPTRVPSVDWLNFAETYSPME